MSETNLHCFNNKTLIFDQIYLNGLVTTYKNSSLVRAEEQASSCSKREWFASLFLVRAVACVALHTVTSLHVCLNTLKLISLC